MQVYPQKTRSAGKSQFHTHLRFQYLEDFLLKTKRSTTWAEVSHYQQGLCLLMRHSAVTISSTSPALMWRWNIQSNGLKQSQVWGFIVSKVRWIWAGWGCWGSRCYWSESQHFKILWMESQGGCNVIACCRTWFGMLQSSTRCEVMKKLPVRVKLSFIGEPLTHLWRTVQTVQPASSISLWLTEDAGWTVIPTLSHVNVVSRLLLQMGKYITIITIITLISQ